MKFLVLSDIHDKWTYLDEMIRLAQSLDGVIFLGDLMSFRKIVPLSMENFTLLYDAANWMVAVPGNGPLPEVVNFLTSLGVNIHGDSVVFDDIGFFGVGGVSDPIELILGLREYFIRDCPKPIELNEKSIETLNIFGIYIRDGKFEVEEWDAKHIRDIEKYHSPFEHSEHEIYDFLAKGYKGITHQPLRILISHIPPYEPGLNSILPEGVSTGSKSIAHFIRTFIPSYSLSGHYHIHYEFDIDRVPCAILPAVVDDCYSIFSIDTTSKTMQIKVNKF